MTMGPPWFVLVSGVNGSGKSTFAQNSEAIKELCGLTGAVDEIEIINPDLITIEIKSSDPHLSLADANIRAADACEERVRELVEGATRSLVIETVLSTDKYKASNFSKSGGWNLTSPVGRS
jgi:predicted ABC-type ATPase